MLSNTCKVLYKRWKDMTRDLEDSVMTTREACHYLRISRPTYLKHLYKGKIRGVKVGKGWKVLKSELDRFLKGDYDYPTHHPADWLFLKISPWDEGTLDREERCREKVGREYRWA